MGFGNVFYLLVPVLNLRILSPSLSSSSDMVETLKLLADAYPAAYQTLYEAKPITCSVTGTTFDAVPAPCAAILDVSQSTGMLHASVTVNGDVSIS